METLDPTDDQLVDRTKAGDARAFDELVVRFSPRLYGLIYNMTSSHEDTNDLLQEVFAKAYRSIRGFQGKSSFYTWMHTISVNMTINFPMFDIQGMPHADIAKILKISEGTVRSRLFYAHKQLQNHLQEFIKK